MAAYLARRWTDATLTELAADLGLSRAESVSNLRRRMSASIGRSFQARQGVERDREELGVESEK